MLALVVRSFKFDAAHYLEGYPGKCANIHGHTWMVQVGVRKMVGDDGIACDFGEMKSKVMPFVDELDHTLLNFTLHHIKPTAEMLAYWFLERLARVLEGVEFVRVYESQDCYAEVSRYEVRGL